MIECLVAQSYYYIDRWYIESCKQRRKVAIPVEKPLYVCPKTRRRLVQLGLYC